MKKRIVLLCTLLILSGCSLFEKAPKLNFSEHAEITVYHMNEKFEERLSFEQAEILLEALNQMSPTSIPSIQDVPNQKIEHTLKVQEIDKETIIFFYQDGGKYYAEIPYTGVYKCEEELYHSLSQYAQIVEEVPVVMVDGHLYVSTVEIDNLMKEMESFIM